MPEAGHNHVAPDALRLLIERVERLVDERQGINDDIKDVFAEAKVNGYDVRTMRAMIKERRMEKHAHVEMLALQETYRRALGLMDDD